MNNKPILQIILFVSVLVINITGIVNGIRYHENWLTVAGSVGLALIIFAAVVRYKRNRSIL